MSFMWEVFNLSPQNNQANKKYWIELEFQGQTMAEGKYLKANIRSDNFSYNCEKILTNYSKYLSIFLPVF